MHPFSGSPQAAVFTEPCVLGLVARVLKQYMQALGVKGPRASVAASVAEHADSACAAVNVFRCLMVWVSCSHPSPSQLQMQEALALVHTDFIEPMIAHLDSALLEELSIQRLQSRLSSCKAPCGTKGDGA